MSRRRYISTDISRDSRINRLAEENEFAALLYTWMIPHADDDGILAGDVEEILFTVLPGRRNRGAADVATALDAMDALGLVAWDRDGERVVFPPTAFYRYQTYVPTDKRRTAPGPDDPPSNAANTEKRREPPDNAEKGRFVKPSPSPSCSVSPSPSGPAGHGGGAAAPGPPAPPGIPAEFPSEHDEAASTGDVDAVLDAWEVATARKLPPGARPREAPAAKRLLETAGSVAEAAAYLAHRVARGQSPELKFAARDYTPRWQQAANGARASPPGKGGLSIAELMRGEV